jgi:hypothetical protein
MRMFAISDDIRNEPYDEGDGREEGDGGKCGSCNWPADTVYQMADTEEGANECFRENHRGLCGDCMCELLADGEYEITAKAKP